MADSGIIGDYDAEPVYYCRRCLSLRVLSECGVDYCAGCGSTDVGTCLIGDWLVMSEEREARAERFYEGVEDDRAEDSRLRRGKGGLKGEC